MKTKHLGMVVLNQNWSVLIWKLLWFCLGNERYTAPSVGTAKGCGPNLHF